jgi:hypothetical protein
MIYTRLIKLLMAPVLAGILLCPSGVYGQATEKATVSTILKSPDNYNELKVQVTGFVKDHNDHYPGRQGAGRRRAGKSRKASDLYPGEVSLCKG